MSDFEVINAENSDFEVTFETVGINDAAAAQAFKEAAEAAATAAAISEGNASDSEDAAAASASSAEAHKTAAQTAQTAAEGARDDAQTAQTAAEGARDDAQTAQTVAEGARDDAQTAQAAAEAAYDNFDDRYLGAKAADPATDNDGNPLVTGALYFNTSAGEMRVWDGASWQVSYNPTPGSVDSVFTRTGAVTAQAGDYEDGQITAAASATNYTPSAPHVEGHLAGIDTALGVRQPLDATLTALAGLTFASDRGLYATGPDALAVYNLTPFGRALGGYADEASFKVGVNLEIGTDVQAHSANLDTWAGLAPSADAQSLVTSANYAAMRTLLDLEPGTDVQPADELLTEIAALSTDPGSDSGLFFDDSDNAIGYWTPTLGLEFSNTTLRVTDNLRNDAIEFVIDGGGSPITTGIKGYLEVPWNCTIQRATLIADQSGDIVIDVWVDTYANAPPTDADSITASAPPTLSAAQKSQDSTLSGWTTALTAGGIIGFNVDSVSTVERVTLSLKVTKT